MTAQRWSDNRSLMPGWHAASRGTEPWHGGCRVPTTGQWDTGSWGRAALATVPPGSLLGTGSPELVRSILTIFLREMNGTWV